MICNIFVSLILFVSCSYGANILAILPTPSFSHQIAYTHIWKELSLRGHKVTLITTDPIKDPSLTNLTEIDMKWTYSFLENFSETAQNDLTMWNMHQNIQELLFLVSRAQISHSDIQNLIHSKSHFDVVMVEFLFPEYLAFAEIFNCPKIIFSSLDSTAILHHIMGNPLSPALYPDMAASFFGPLNFKERVLSTLFTWNTMNFYYHSSYSKRTQLVKEYFNLTKTVNEILRDVDMMFISVNPILQSIRALGPSTVFIGGDRPIVLSKSMPQEVQQFLDNAKDGFIYFSLGSNVKSKDLDGNSLSAIIEALGELPYKVLWKFEADEFPNKPPNVHLIKWAPQQKVLSHRNIKLFITQGGLQSFEEAFYREVPLVVIPFFGDQDYNARLMESKGIAVTVNRHPSIKKIELKTAILEVINNPKYRNAIKKLKHLALDFPMTGLEKAIWWTEYVIRNKGAKHLRNPAADIPFYQYYLIDVISFLILSVFVILMSMYLTIRLLYRRSKLFLFSYISTVDIKSKKIK